MKKVLSSAFLILSLLNAQSAASETIQFDQITTSKMLAISVASGITANDVSELFEEFDGVSVFESKRMREAAVKKIVAESVAYGNGSITSVQISYMMPVSQFDFESSSFGVCVPRVMFVTDDLPLKADLPIRVIVGAFEYGVSDQRIEYKKREGHFRLVKSKRDLSGDDFVWVCNNGKIFDRVEFSETSLGITDVSQAEKFDADISQVGDGFLSARFTCDLAGFDVGYGQLEASCQATKIELYSVNDGSMSTPLFEGKFSKP